MQHNRAEVVTSLYLSFFLSALTKGVGLRSDGRIDDRSFWINHVSSLSTPLAIPLIYPRMIAVHDLDTKEVWSYIFLMLRCCYTIFR